jgi:hypothetical protein
MDAKKRKLVEKLEELNQRRAMIHHDFQSLKERKKGVPPKKYQRLIEKYHKKEEKIKQKIRSVEEELCSLT